MLVNKDAPYRTVKEFVAFAQAHKPGEPVFSGYGNASSRVPSALFEARSGVRFEGVACRDAVPSIQDLAAGLVPTSRRSPRPIPASPRSRSCPFRSATKCQSRSSAGSTTG